MLKWCVSSAYKVEVKISGKFVRSFTYVRISKGPKIKPCGIPILLI